MGRGTLLIKRTKQIMNVDLGERAGLVWIGGKEKSDKQQGQSKGGRYAARSEAGCPLGHYTT
jgi:hypothetical protein